MLTLVHFEFKDGWDAVRTTAPLRETVDAIRIRYPETIRIMLRAETLWDKKNGYYPRIIAGTDDTGDDNGNNA